MALPGNMQQIHTPQSGKHTLLYTGCNDEPGVSCSSVHQLIRKFKVKFSAFLLCVLKKSHFLLFVLPYWQPFPQKIFQNCTIQIVYWISRTLLGLELKPCQFYDLISQMSNINQIPYLTLSLVFSLSIPKKLFQVIFIKRMYYISKCSECCFLFKVDPMLIDIWCCQAPQQSPQCPHCSMGNTQYKPRPRPRSRVRYSRSATGPVVGYVHEHVISYIVLDRNCLECV